MKISRMRPTTKQGVTEDTNQGKVGWQFQWHRWPHCSLYYGAMVVVWWYWYLTTNVERQDEGDHPQVLAGVAYFGHER